MVINTTQFIESTSRTDIIIRCRTSNIYHHEDNPHLTRIVCFVLLLNTLILGKLGFGKKIICRSQVQWSTRPISVFEGLDSVSATRENRWTRSLGGWLPRHLECPSQVISVIAFSRTSPTRSLCRQNQICLNSADFPICLLRTSQNSLLDDVVVMYIHQINFYLSSPWRSHADLVEKKGLAPSPEYQSA